MHLATGGALVALANLLSLARAAASCQPGQTCWPSLAEWDAFNQTVSGRLKVTSMLASPCFESSPDFNNATCAVVEENATNGTFLQSVYGALEITEWEACGSQNCYPGIGGTTCSLGSLSALYVDAETSADISATLKFVQSHGIRLVVKNTGHDYLGRSAAPNSLALRTYNLKNMTFKSSFTASSCNAANKQNIGIIGAGVNADEAISFFANHNMMVTTGGCHSVGIAGGFGMAGGHGPLAPTYGLMVDQAVEFDVVTTDGVFRTINQCNEPDLFWAMRGGGGSAYAILVNYKFQVHPQTQWAVWRLEASVTPTSSNVSEDTVLRDVLTALANNQSTWSKNMIAGYDVVTATEVTFLEILPASGNPTNTLKAQTSAFNKFLTSHPGLNVTMNTYVTYNHEADFYTGQADYLERSGGVGIGVRTPSRLITTDNFANASKVDALVSGMLAALQTVNVQLGPALTPAVALLVLKTTPINTPDTEKATSANPAWRDSLWHLLPAAGWPTGTPASITNQISAAASAALDNIKEPLSVQACYLNEADPNEEDWESVYFGANYDKLLQIKQKWDPNTVLNCYKCMGYLPDDPMYSCYGDSPVGSTAYPF